MGWAKEKGLHAERDQVGNILIRANLPPQVWKTVSQWYCRRTWTWFRRNNDTVHDFTKDPISRTSTASG
ncbi:hypothetical protein ACVXG7_00525 [Enterobacter hormaechei]